LNFMRKIVLTKLLGQVIFTIAYCPLSIALKKVANTRSPR
jgi:hypothetical protein